MLWQLNRFRKRSDNSVDSRDPPHSGSLWAMQCQRLGQDHVLLPRFYSFPRLLWAATWFRHSQGFYLGLQSQVWVRHSSHLISAKGTECHTVFSLWGKVAKSREQKGKPFSSGNQTHVVPWWHASSLGQNNVSKSEAVVLTLFQKAIYMIYRTVS